MSGFRQGFTKESVVVVAICSLLMSGSHDALAFQATPPAAPQAFEQSPEQLQRLVAPIALYPDSLIAQILAAATYPNQIVEAQQWMQEHKDWHGEKLAREVDKQAWDPSVKALTQFPAVLGNMNQNLAWTSELGDAYLNQAQELNQAIQTMRQKAQQAGTLTNTPQQNVVTQGDFIVIEPAVPDVVYVPMYDPWLVYGYAIPVWPGWYSWPGLYVATPGIYWGVGFEIGFFAGYGWGWGHWSYDWHGRYAVYDHRTYVSHSSVIVNRRGYERGGYGRGDYRNGGSYRGGSDAGHQGYRGETGSRSGAFSGYDHGGVARQNSYRGAASVGGSRAGGGFHGGGRR
jgi:hypothetical protein